ncbi:hypothetical protein Hamer_G017372 [Homarus americanus]|uniref:Uncharacterized protein n=1 Tax=Homarus americanus TaxID=6706 RepID=A0A8J5MQG1_HOMAM|nr:hypothetical protein Hamer_G017372 [Homarus americanus]
MLLVGGVVTAHPAHILLPFQLEYNIKLASGEDITGGEVEVTSLEQDQLMQFPPAPYSQLASPDLASFPQPHLDALPKTGTSEGDLTHLPLHPSTPASTPQHTCLYTPAHLPLHLNTAASTS